MEPHDSLPYIDAEITPAERDAANTLIHREIAHDRRQQQQQLDNDRNDDGKLQYHPSLQLSYEPHFSELFSKEIARHATGKARTSSSDGGIDTSRYEAPEEPSDTTDVAQWKNVLKTASVSSTYLSGRRANLALLDEWGKNAWLMGNYELEGICKTLEAELADAKSQTEAVNRARKIAQEESHAELAALEESWKTGVGRMIEVQVATEQLRHGFNQQAVADGAS